MAYVKAFYCRGGFGGEKVDSIKSDSLMYAAANKGMVDAYITLAMDKYSNLKDGVYHDKAEEAFKLMEIAAEHSDRARIWLAEKTRMGFPISSRKYVSEISDSLNLYKIIREIDDALLESYVNGVKVEKNNKLQRLDMLLTNSHSLLSPQTVVEENVFLAYLGIMSAIRMRHLIQTEFFTVASYNLDVKSGLFFMPFEIAINQNVSNIRHLIDDYKVMAQVWLESPETDTSAYLRTRVKGRMEDHFLGSNSILCEYPVKVWSRVAKDMMMYKMPSEIYQYPE